MSDLDSGATAHLPTRERLQVHFVGTTLEGEEKLYTKPCLATNDFPASFGASAVTVGRTLCLSNSLIRFCALLVLKNCMRGASQQPTPTPLIVPAQVNIRQNIH